MSMERLPHFHRCCSHVNPFRQEIDSLKSEIKILVEVNERDYSDRSAAVRLADKEVVAIRAERDALAKEVEQLKISNENLKTTIGYWWPKLGYSKFNEMVYPALDDHRATEAPAFTERDRLRSKLEVAREFFKKIAAHQVSMGAPNSFAATEARTALAQIGEGHEGA